jgi:hypothetical protein
MLSNWLAESVSKLSCLKDFSLPAVASSHEVEGMMETKIPSLSALRKMICVANRVHRVLSRGNGRLVSPSKTEDFPLDWSPTTTSCAQSITASDSVPRKISIPVEVIQCLANAASPRMLLQQRLCHTVSRGHVAPLHRTSLALARRHRCSLQKIEHFGMLLRILQHRAY